MTIYDVSITYRLSVTSEADPVTAMQSALEEAERQISEGVVGPSHAKVFKRLSVEGEE